MRTTTRVLIADDDTVAREIARGVLGRFGYDCQVVADGEAAVEAAAAESYDVILMDLRMPRMGGIRATASIRQSRREAVGPWIIAFTTERYAEVWPDCAAAGMDGFLSKPCPPAEMLEAIAHVRRREASS